MGSTFILAITGAIFTAIGMGSIYFHAVPVLTNAGYSSHSAGLLFGGTWLLSALGSAVMGAVTDRFGAKTTLASALCCGALGAYLLLGAGTGSLGTACVWAFVILWGMPANAYGQLVPVIFAERMGSESLGTLMGLEWAAAGIAGTIAPVITGVLFDYTGSYRPGISLSGTATFFAFAVVLLIHRRGQTMAPSARAFP